MEDIKNIKNGITHAGSFHSDDVFATALLQILNPEMTIERKFKVPEDFDGIVYDIGLGKYDHHQRDKRYRENGVPFAAFGLLWEEFGTMIMTKEDADAFDKNFIQPMDLSDNTGVSEVIPMLIDDRNLAWNEEGDVDEEFFKAVEWAKELLKYRFKKINAKRMATDIVLKKLEKHRNETKGNAVKSKIFYLDDYMPWKDAVIGTEILYVIYASNRGGFNIQSVAISKDSPELVKPFPNEWWGQESEKLKELTGVSGMRFCHSSGFLAGTESLEAAMKIAEISVLS